MFMSLFYRIITHKSLQRLLLLVLTFTLSGCDNNTSTGENENYQGQAKCWQTSITGTILKSISGLFNDAASKITQSKVGVNIICILFAIWMAIRLLKVLSSFKEENLGEVWTEIGQKLFLCAFCAYILTDVNTISNALRDFVLPIYLTLLDLASRLLGIEHVTSIDLGFFGTITYSSEYQRCTITAPSSATNLAITTFQETLRSSVNCLVCNINDRLNGGLKIAIALICSLRVSAFIIGVLLLVLFIAAKFGFVLYLVDALFRINFAIYLLPFLIVGIPFSWSRPKCVHMFKMFINSSGIMMFMALLISIVISSLEAIYGTLTLNTSTLEGLSPELLSLVLIGLLILNTPGLAVALTDKFIGGGGTSKLQEKISKFVMRLVRSAAAIAMNSTTGGATGKLNDMLDKYEKVRDAKDAVKRASDTVSSLAGGGDD
jgi:hypothetical protein